MAYGLGVDLGTTHTAAAVRADDRVEIVQLGGRRAEIPSLVLVRPDGSLLVGDAAERRGQSEPGRLAREFKRRIGDPVPILVGGVPFSAHALTAKLLRHVLDTVTELQGRPPSVIVVTHPANWGQYKREQLDQALRQADAGQVRLRTEPEAAALQHATFRRIQPGDTVAVYDLGGGTFDAAVLRRDDRGFTLLGEPEGIEQLGGIDFDEAVFGHVMDTLGSMVQVLDPGDPDATTAVARLRRDCVEAKEGLSFDTEVMIPVALPGLHTRVRLNRSELEAMIAPALEDTVASMQRALRSAGVAPESLGAILLAGGSSRIPLVSQLLSTVFERPVIADPHPEHSIALGAAIATARDTGPPARRIAAVSVVPAAAAPDPVQSATADPVRSAAEPAAQAIPAPPVSDPSPRRTGVRPSDLPATRTTPATPGPTSTPGRTPAAGPTSTDGPASTNGAAAVSPTVTPGPAIAYAPGVARVAGGPAPGGTAITAGTTPPGPPSERRISRRSLLVGGTVASLAGIGATAAIILTADGDKPGSAAAPISRSAPQPSTPSTNVRPPIPTAAILMRRDTGGPFPSSATTEIVVAVPGRPERTVISSTGEDMLPMWSHDRTRLALTRRVSDIWQVWVVERDGSKPVRAIGYMSAGTRVSWSPDDTRLAFMRRVGKVSQLHIQAVGKSTATQLTRANVDKDDPAWSPDGTTIAYWARVDGEPQIFLLSVDDPAEPGRQITSGSQPAVDPAWSPDGTRIAYTRVTGSGQSPGRVGSGRVGSGVSQIWMVNADGTGARAVVSGSERNMDPTFSPDGEWIAFTRGDLAHPKVHIVRTDGTDLRSLTTGQAREGHPSWT